VRERFKNNNNNDDDDGTPDYSDSVRQCKALFGRIMPTQCHAEKAGRQREPTIIFPSWMAGSSGGWAGGAPVQISNASVCNHVRHRGGAPAAERQSSVLPTFSVGCTHSNIAMTGAHASRAPSRPRGFARGFSRASAAFLGLLAARCSWIQYVHVQGPSDPREHGLGAKATSLSCAQPPRTPQSLPVHAACIGILFLMQSSLPGRSCVLGRYGP